MTGPIVAFGQSVEGYSVPVLNERAVRAGAGILFAAAIIAFMNAWLLGNFRPTRVFVVAFLLDFTIRIFVNPRFAPSLIIGQWFVRRQQPEFVGAPQKRFAWAIGFGLASLMFYMVVLNQMVGPVNIIVCALCLALLFFETAFGICIGCWVYERICGTPAELCPGGVCDYVAPAGSGGNVAQGAIVLLFALTVAGLAGWLAGPGPQTGASGPRETAAPAAAASPAEIERCKVPEFAKRLGHEEMWKLHNNCK